MASPPPTIDPRDQNFLREVDEQYRLDQLKDFGRKYGRWIALVVGLGLIALAAALFWRVEQEKKLDALSERFTAAIEDSESGAAKEAATEFDAIAEDGNPTYRALARFARAGAATNGGDAKAAITALEGVARDDKAPTALKDAATLKMLQLQFDTLPPAEILKKAQPYLDGDNPWFAVAGELAALAYVKDGKPDKAGPLFFRLASDERISPTLRARAEQMAASLGQDVTRLMEPEEGEAQAAAPEPAANGGGK